MRECADEADHRRHVAESDQPPVVPQPPHRVRVVRVTRGSRNSDPRQVPRSTLIRPADLRAIRKRHHNQIVAPRCDPHHDAAVNGHPIKGLRANGRDTQEQQTAEQHAHRGVMDASHANSSQSIIGADGRRLQPGSPMLDDPSPYPAPTRDRDDGCNTNTDLDDGSRSVLIERHDDNEPVRRDHDREHAFPEPGSSRRVTDRIANIKRREPAITRARQPRSLCNCHPGHCTRQHADHTAAERGHPTDDAPRDRAEKSADQRAGNSAPIRRP